MSRSINIAASIKDFAESLRQWRVWAFWAQHELHQRYRRSFLGPLWISFSMAFHIIAVGVVWAVIFHAPYAEYIPYIAWGMTLWTLVSSIMMEGAHCFIGAQGLITQTTRPLPTYFLQMVYKNVLNFGHNCLAYLLVALHFKIIPGHQAIYFPLAFPLMIIGIGWVGFVFGLISVRYRDVPNLIQSLMIVLVLVTPVMFHEEALNAVPNIVRFNPLYHLIQIVRAPILGQSATMNDWIWSVGFAVFGWALTLILYARYRTRVAYWL